MKVKMVLWSKGMQHIIVEDVKEHAHFFQATPGMTKVFSNGMTGKFKGIYINEAGALVDYEHKKDVK